MRFVATIVFIYSLTISGIGQADIETGKYLYRSHQVDDYNLNYRILYPEGFDANKSYPLLLFLHGRGECGSDNEKQLVHGSKLFLDSMQNYPAIVVFPQCPTDDYWANLYRPEKGGATRKFTFHYEDGPKPALKATIDLVNQLLAEDYTDEARFYITGLSMGGMGVWELLWRMPEKIAAAVPICGGGAREMASKMTGVPIWAIHGAKDDVVHPRYSIMMVKAIQQAGGTAKISLFPDANHNSWDPAFADPDYLSWMFVKVKSKK